MRRAISECTELHRIFAIGRTMKGLDNGRIHSMNAQGTLLWQPILEAKSAFSAYEPLFVSLSFQNGL